MKFIKQWQCDVQCVCETHTFRWINEEAKMIWWEVPRCASSTIQETIDQSIWRHITTDEIDDLPYQDYFNFAVQTNPWRRVASNYWLFNCYLGRVDEGKMLSANVTFPQFVENMFKEGYRNHHWYPVSCYVPPEDAPFDYTIIPLEDLTEEWIKLAEEHHQPHLADRPRSYNRFPWQEYYDDCPDVIEVVEKHYIVDIERFNHQHKEKE